MDEYTEEWLIEFFKILKTISTTNKKILKGLNDIYFLLEEEKKNNKYEGK